MTNMPLLDQIMTKIGHRSGQKLSHLTDRVTKIVRSCCKCLSKWQIQEAVWTF